MISRLSFALLLWIAFLNGAEAQTVGRTPGQFNVSAIGSAQYSVPIWAPPGPRGMQPNLSLLYDSQSSIGPLGIGWSLVGLGQITRCNLTTAQDTTPAPVALVTGDGYCLDGKRLRLTGGTYGTAGSTYQTEIADFSNITANLTAGNGPKYFTVQGRNGLTYYYGYTDSNGNGVNSEILANGTTTAVTWLLSKVVDRAGNNYVINYLAPSTSLSGTSVPNKILWTPAAAGSSSYTYTMQFNYGTNFPQSSIFQYVAGTVVSNTELLTSIEIFHGATVVKDYFLGYQTSPLTGRKELTSIKECADSVGSNCLMPTTVTYQTGSPGLSTVSNMVPSSAGAVASRYDFNGDGYPDLVFNNGTSWYVAFGSASGYGAPFNTGISVGPGPALFGNVTGAHQDGILTVVGSSTWTYYVWNGSNFIGTPITGFPYDATSKNYILADVNGDGLPDLVSQKDTNTIVGGHNILTSVISFQLNTSSPTAANFSAALTTAYSTGGGTTLSVFLQGPDAQYGKIRRYDFNGDGRDDLVVQIESGTVPNLTLSTYELISTGTAFTAAKISTVTASTTAIPVFFTNWNDDKCTDFVTSNTLYVSGCNGSAPQTYSLPGSILVALDWDGDGRTDILVQNGSTIGVYLSQATSTSPTLTATSVPYSASCTYVWMDANGDGLDDLGCFSSAAASYYLHNVTSDLATSFADGYGNSASPTYIPLSEGNYTEHYNDATFPDQDYIGPLYVVSEAIYNDPSSATGATYNQTFWYYGAWINLQGRGFEGFGAIESLDSRNGLYDLKYYSTIFPFTGMRYQEDVSNATFNFSQTTGIEASTTLSTTTNQQRYFPYFNQLGIYKWEVGGSENADLITTTNVSYTYDNYGNATNIITTVTDNDPGSPYNGVSWSTDVINTTDISINQSADLAAWCLTMLDEQQTIYESTLSSATTVTRTRTYTPDTPANCRIKTIVTEPTANSSLYEVTEALGFDAFGNVSTDTVTGNNMPSSPASRLTTLNWGTTGQFLNTRTDPSNAITTWTYTSANSLTFGVPDSVKDANNLTTSWVYDAFGRKNKETRPDMTSTTWTWSTCTSFCGWSNSFYQVAQTQYQSNGSTVIRTDTNFYDPIDRVTESSGPTVTGTLQIVQNLYNSLGLQTQQSLPYISGGSAYQKTFFYDALNRLMTATRPISSTNSNPQSTNYAYAGRKLVVSDPYSHNKTIINDVNGQLRQTTDAFGYSITRTYDAASSLTGVTDSVGNTLLSGVTYKYGIKPFRVADADADRGAWTYTIDSLGERTGWTDAKGQSFSMTYDSLSRPLTRTEPDLFSQWTYGSTPASHNVGQLISECSNTTGSCGATPIYTETRTFDSEARLSTRSIKDSALAGNNTGGVFLFTYGYSSTTGLPSSLTYPISTSTVALNLSYVYQYGLLLSVTDTTDTTATCGTSCTLWAANSVNAFGEVTKETLGNGVVTNRTYDAVTSWLSAATAGVGGGATLLNQSYTEDENGNVTQRQNNNLGLTENFFYDADNRLLCATLASSCSTNTFAYDGGAAGPGNITSQTGVGTYTYPAAGQPRPHAVTSLTGTFNGIVNPSFSYDANGNMTNRASSTANVIWTSFNYPSSISGTDVTGTETVAINYGPDRQRVQQNYTGPTGVESTFYIGGLMDIVIKGTTTDYRHYVYAGGEPVAVYSRTAAGVNTMSYMLEDHQGSISTIASKSGAVDVNESFSAFGQRRSPTSWSGAPIAGDLNTIAGLSRQGYTFQTALGQSMGLNHMNGRVEDAILGRFLSPDPHITDQSNAQNYNLYSYVNNNPLTYMDPTGFDDECDSCVKPIDGSPPPEGKDSDMQEVVVTSSAPGSTVTNFAPGGYVATAPDGNEVVFGVAHKPGKVSSGITIQAQGSQNAPPKNQRPPCPTFADVLAANRAASNTSTADALAGASMVNDFLGGAADVAGKAASKAGRTASFLEGAGRLGTVFGAGYTVYQGSVAIRTHNPDAAYDAGFGGTTLAVATIPTVGPPLAFGMGVGNILGQLVLPPAVPPGPLSRYAAKCMNN